MSSFDAEPRPRAASSGAPRTEDPDVGPTRKTPSTQERLDQSELAIRGLKLRHIQQQTKMIEQANEITRYPEESQ